MRKYILETHNKIKEKYKSHSLMTLLKGTMHFYGFVCNVMTDFKKAIDGRNH